MNKDEAISFQIFKTIYNKQSRDKLKRFSAFG